MMKVLRGNQRFAVSIFVTTLIVLGIYNTGYTDITPVSERTSQVRDAIVAEVPGVDAAADVTETHLGAIISLNLRTKSISALNSGDFSGLSGLTDLNLYKNELSSLPDGIFKNLAALTTLRLGGNTVNPFPLTVSLEKVGEDQFKAVAPTGAPFDIILPISAIHGSISDNATSLTIPKGSTESTVVTVSRTADTTAAVTATIGTLPSLPLNHYGYVLTKSNVLPLEVLSAVTTTPPPVETPIFPPPIEPPTTNIAPVFTDGTAAIRSIAENTASGTNIGTAVSATDTNENDTLTYTLGGIDAASFEIDSTNGQLKTKNELDYEMKRVYSITISVSDGSLTDTITVIVSVIDVDDTPFVSTILAVSDRTPEVRDAIVASVLDVSSANEVTDAHLAAITSLNLRSAGITELKSGDFSGMTGLAGLNLYGNMLNTLPMGIFEGVSSLNSLRLGGNLIDPLPLIVSVQQMDVSEFRAVVRTGAPFDILLPIGAMMVTIPKGSLTSAAFTALSTPNINALPVLPANHFGYVLAKSTVCNRTIQVSDAIVDALPGIDDCRNVSDVHLATITSLNLSNMSLTSLKTGDFAGMLSLTTLNLDNNQLSSLPDGIFDALTALTTVDLSGNFVSPLPLSISLQKVGSNQIKAVVPTGAPFDIVLPITVANGSSEGSALTISTGNDESQTLTVSRTSGMTAAVTVDIALPSLPISHRGYALVKSNLQPLEVFEDINIAPVFTEGATATRTIAENTPVDTNIGTAVSATDANSDTLTYTLSGTDATSFDIISTSGQLKTRAALDYENIASYSVIVTVSDGTLTDSIVVTVNVTNVDENRAPVFTDGESTTRTVAENTVAGTNIGAAVDATDADGNTLTYSLGGTDSSSFGIDSSSGQLRTTDTLDYETKDSYSVTITVSDGKGGSDSISVTINITNVDESAPNNAPTFTDGESTTRTVAENTASGVDIGNAVSATDADDDTVSYSLGGTDESSFGIDSSSGQLRTTDTLDYETKDSYSVTITVSDGKGGSDSISVTINITNVDESAPNNAPTFTDGDSTTRTVAENTASGVDIGSAVSAKDADADTISYSLGGTDESSFGIDSSSGQLRTSDTLDYETKDSYSVTITVSDGKGGSDSISVTINITNVDESAPNNAPTFTDGESTTRTVAENTASGVDIGSVVSAKDADDDTLSYSLGGTDSSSFGIDSSSGQLRTSDTLDYETKDSYSVTITVSDGKGGSDSISVTINIRNVDESAPNNAPTFTDGESTTRIVAENTATQTNIGSAITATDADNDTLTYSLSGTNESSFEIVSSSGQLKTKDALNHETKSAYAVTISVSDGEGGSDSISVTINVTNVNEAPVFSDGTTTTRAIAENVAANINIGTAVKATDPDTDDNLIYTLGGTDAASFDIDDKTGQLKTKVTLDFETKSSYSVTVTAKDVGNLTDSITVTISVTNLDETPSNIAPIFDDGEETTREIAENTPADRNIGAAVSATDTDSNTLAYVLGGNDALSFSIDLNTGQLKTSTALDHENDDTYVLTVTVNDGSSTDTISVTISVTDVNEAPTFADDSITLSVAENTAANTNIGSVITATDPDGDDLTYNLEGTDADSFDIVSTTGQLKTKAALDYESETSYSVTLKASDDNLSNTISVTINVTDVDENRAPAFATENTTRTVAENTGSGVDIGTAVSATDADDDTLTYTLSGTDAPSFDIGSTNGQLRTKAALDYEDKTSYSVTITASDGKKSDSITVTITVTDVDENRAPVFASESTTRTVAENTGSGVNIGGAVSATDADDDTLTYTLSGTDAPSFDIGSTNGQLRTKAALDYEDKTSYSVTITASDGKKSDSIDVTITVTDVDENRAPAFASESTTRTVAENTGSGVNIGGAVSATDADDDTLTYTLSGTDAPSFDIGSTNGQLRTKAALDYETKSTYSVTITASDGKKSDSIDVTITVTDVDENRAPVFASESTTRTVAENTGSGVNIGGAVSATDADDDTLTYTLSGTDAPSFDIGSTNGQLRTKATLDYETKSSYSVTITASDGKKSDSIDVTITVTDVDENRAPAFASESTTRTVAENTGSGVNIGGAVSATDADDDTLTYTLSGTDAPSFDIGSTNGQLRTNATLDYETKSSYSVTITASDGKKSDSIDVTITVTDVDENRAPVFASESTTRTVAENTGSGVNIGGAVSATDADDDTLTYTLSGTDAPSFDIGSTNGQLRTNAALDYETKTSYSVTITASDGKKSDSITVTITVTDIDENRAPVFASESTTRTVAENTGSGVNIGGAVSATDADDDTLTYTLSGTDAASFSIVSTSGQLQTSSALDYETKTSYSVTLTVSDGSLTDSINVTINVTDVNEAPVFTNNSFSYLISNISIATVDDNIGSAITATDPDGDMLTFSVGGDDASYFSIDSSSGQLKVTQALIDDTSSSYFIKVIATDPSDATVEISGTITVTRLATQQQNTNNAPTFHDGVSTTRCIAENTASGQDIDSPVSAFDDDIGDTLTYSLESTDAASFSIVSTSGQLQTSAALDYETKSSYSVTVKVTDDSGASNNSTTITVTIKVTNVGEPGVNDAPVFQYGDSVTLSVNKGERLGTSIRAFDDEEDELTYTLGGTDAALFKLHEDYEYYLQSKDALFYDNKTSYSVTITVSDGNGGSNTITVTITDTAPEVEIETYIGYDEPDWVLKLDTETGIVTASLCDDDEFCIFATGLLYRSSISFTRPPGVQFDNGFSVAVVFSEKVSGFEQSELTLTDNTAGATISGWQSQGTHFGYVFSAFIDVTTSGSVTFNVAAGVATDSGDQLNTAAESATFTVTITITDYPPWDVNEDGSVDDTDTALVTAALGQTGEDIVNERTDVNWDNTVDADDVTLVTYHIEDDVVAPSIVKAFSLLDKKTLEKLDPVTLQSHLDILRTESDGSPRYLRAIAIVESILTAIRPSKTQLLPNYPNPFNPETWIPYQLSKSADVTLTIYNMQGVVVRQLELGQKPTGIYRSQSRAIHWDGRNNIGEKVASGVYFYMLKAGDFSAMRKMVIRK